MAAGNGPDNAKRLRAAGHGLGQGRVGRFVGQIFYAGEEAQERPPLLGGVVADGAAQDGVARLQRIEQRPLCGRPANFDRDLRARPGQGAQVVGDDDANHGSACTSTDSTAGRSWTMVCQVSPPSALA